MNRLLQFLMVVTLLIVGSGCSKKELTEAEMEAKSHILIENDRVGRIKRGNMVKRLYDIYGKERVKMLVNSESDTLFQSKSNYFVYSEESQLLFIAIAPTDGSNVDIIENIVIKSRRVATKEGINMNSSFGEIREAYPDATVIQHDSKVYVYIPTVDLYFRVRTADISGYDSEFIADIPIDSIRANAKPISMSVNWYTGDGDIFSLQYWRDVWRKIISWLTRVLPVMAAQAAFVYALLQLGIWLIRRVQRLVIKRAQSDANLDSEETSKRVKTLAGIIRGLLSIVAWIMILLIVLSNFNINIGPIIASAGIVGLAVGFGAQELVRDFISGFFILFENQLRTGDVAIIDGKEGFVEKIELRTITLRDLSGVVHIFQNGKINYLSNMTKEWSAITLDIGVSYREDVDEVMEIMLREGRLLREDAEFGELMLSDVEMLGLDKFDDSAIIFKVVIRTRPRMQWKVKREYQRRLKIAFDKADIEIPFPQVTLSHAKAKNRD